MRELRVLGIAETGDRLICVETTEDGPSATPAATFTIPLDERLRAAVRGDLTRLGQLEIDMAPQLRPREIQRRIRAGASVEQVAAAAGCGADKIERYAYPVLMERAAITARGRAVRPLAGAALGSTQAAQADATLDAIVTATLDERGQAKDLAWDAFRDERGWTVTATWRAGRSENRAEWAYRAGPDGGTVTARNAEARDLVDPQPSPLRAVPAADSPDRDDPPSAEDHNGADATSTGTADRTGTSSGSGTSTSAGASSSTDAAAHESADETAQRVRVEQDVTDERSGALGHEEQRARRTGTEGPRSARRGHHPVMPSWEDVLLGTRSSGS